jgi:hypothetical protein
MIVCSENFMNNSSGYNRISPPITFHIENLLLICLLSYLKPFFAE